MRASSMANIAFLLRPAWETAGNRPATHAHSESLNGSFVRYDKCAVTGVIASAIE